MDRITLTAPGLSVAVKTHGAELASLLTQEGDELLWQAGAAWPRHAPVLFPIVGRLPDDTIRHGSHRARLTQHGFARDRAFRLTGRDDRSCELVLEDDADTRAVFPFRFRLSLGYALADRAVAITYRLSNPGDDVLHASLGTHPAFRWPLVDTIAKDAHRLVFAHDEPGPVRRLADGLLLPEPAPSPIAGRVLPLTPDLFANDAVILERPVSRSVRYEADGAPVGLTVSWEGFDTLGLWSKPADFVCIEPWSGISTPRGFAGEFAEKPGLLHLAPGKVVERHLRIAVG